MQNNKIATALIVLSMMLGVVAPVSAQTVEQDQTQEFEVKCETGSYGQITKCKAEGKQVQGQKVVYRDQKGQPARAIYRDGRRIHIPVDTALDARAQLALLAVILGAGFIALIASGKLAK